MFKDKLRYLREHQELSQTEVSKLLGISTSSYSRYECGTNEPSLEILKKIAELFDCTVDYLLEINGTAADFDKVIDLSDFINYGNYTVFSRFPTQRDRKIINSFITLIFKNDKNLD